MNILQNRRRVWTGEKATDIYEGCVTLEFTVLSDGDVRTLTVNHKNVDDYLDTLIIDGVEYTPTKSYQHTFAAGRHKIGWRFVDSVIYANVIGVVSPIATMADDNALVTIPANITEIQSMAMRGIPAYRPYGGVVCYAKTPPDAVVLSIANWYLEEKRYLYVPAGSVDWYKAAEGWSRYASQIVAIP